jgi:hypothetical protein
VPALFHGLELPAATSPVFEDLDAPAGLELLDEGAEGGAHDAAADQHA